MNQKKRSIEFVASAYLLLVSGIGASALWAVASVSLASVPAPAVHTASVANSVNIPANNTFSYAGYGDNEHGHYKIFFYSLTTPDQYQKHLLIWARVDWAKPQESDSGPYQLELMLFHIDCGAEKYAISSHILLTAEGKILKRTDVAPADYVYAQMPTPDNSVFVIGKSSAELGAAAQLMDGCYAYE